MGFTMMLNLVICALQSAGLLNGLRSIAKVQQEREVPLCTQLPAPSDAHSFICKFVYFTFCHLR